MRQNATSEKQLASEDPSKKSSNQVILAVKSLSLLNRSDEDLREIIQNEIVGSHDEDVSRFVSLLAPRKKSSAKGQFLIAFGELILASFLIFLGLVVVAPAMMGFSSPEQVISYYAQVSSQISAARLASPLLALFDFVIALCLLVGGFYTLRLASRSVKESSLSFSS